MAIDQSKINLAVKEDIQILSKLAFPPGFQKAVESQLANKVLPKDEFFNRPSSARTFTGLIMAFNRNYADTSLIKVNDTSIDIGLNCLTLDLRPI